LLRTIFAALSPLCDSLEQLRELARLLEEQPESVIYDPRPTKQKIKKQQNEVAARHQGGCRRTDI